MSGHKPVSNETLIAQLKWRYATKKFDPTRRIPDADWRALEEALVLTPSSFGLPICGTSVGRSPSTAPLCTSGSSCCRFAIVMCVLPRGAAAESLRLRLL